MTQIYEQTREILIGLLNEYCQNWYQIKLKTLTILSDPDCGMNAKYSWCEDNLAAKFIWQDPNLYREEFKLAESNMTITTIGWNRITEVWLFEKEADALAFKLRWL